MTTASTGLSAAASRAVRSTASAISSAVALTAGTNRTITASTTGSARSRGSAAAYVAAVAPPSMSTGFATLASGASSSRRAATVSSPRVGSVEPRGVAGVGRQDPEPTGVREQGDRAPGEARLARQQGRGVDQLLERRRADHTGLVEERVRRRLRPRERRRVRARRALAAHRRAGLQREDGLPPRDPARQAAEAPWVAERLDVEQDGLGRAVVLPPLEQVVRRHVRLVADRHESREAEATRHRGLEQREAEGAALGREADVPGGRRAAGERRVQARPGDGDPEAVRADQARPVGSHEREQLLLTLDSLGPDLCEAGGDDDQGAHALAQGVLGCLEHGARGHADHREVDVVGNLGDRPVPPHARHGGAVPVHGVRGAREVGLEDVAEELATDRAPRLRDAPTTATLRGSKNGRSEAVTATWSLSSSLSS